MKDRIKKKLVFAELQKKCAQKTIKTYSRKGWDKNHANHVIDKATSEIIIWDWVIGSFKELQGV